MTLSGTVINGVVVLEAGACVPEGTKVQVDITDDFERFEYPHPMAPYDRDKEIALLKERYQESKKPGAKFFTLEEVRAEFAREFGLPTSGSS